MFAQETYNKMHSLGENVWTGGTLTFIQQWLINIDFWSSQNQHVLSAVVPSLCQETQLSPLLYRSSSNKIGK